MKQNCMLAVTMLVASISVSAKSEVECKNCKDSGLVYDQKCPVCHGTKYMWVCTGGFDSRTHWNGESSYRQVDQSSQYCGYGSTYKPIHKNCKGTRKRINCPNCAKGKTKSVSTGKVARPCPVCHGKGAQGKVHGVYYVIRDASYVSDEDREFVFLKMDKSEVDGGQQEFRSRIFKKAMNASELADYKAVYPRAKVFESLDEMKEFLRKFPSGTTSTAEVSQPTVYIVKDATQVTANDRRIVFEDLGNGYASYSSRNIIQRRFTEQDVEDFKLINPRCRVFETLAELKAFMRTVRVIDGGTQEYVPRRREVRSIAPTDNTLPSTSGKGAQKTLTMEELDERLKVEMEHEKEMIKRRLGE